MTLEIKLIMLFVNPNGKASASILEGQITKTGITKRHCTTPLLFTPPPPTSYATD